MSNGMKIEPQDFSNIKLDPDHPSPSMADIDEFEDTGELIMPKVGPNWAGPGQMSLPQGWLLRIPKELWAGLVDLPMDEEIRIGDVKVWNMQGKEKWRLEFNQNLPGWDQIPKQYDMNKTDATAKKDKDPTLKNTFIFSEKNMPGFKRNNGVDTKTGGPVKVEKPYKKGPRTIPKHTEMLCQLDAEFTCSPRDNEEFRRIRAAKDEKIKASSRSYTLAGKDEAAELHREAMKIGERGNIVTSGLGTKSKKKSQEDKFVRMEENDLISAIADLFRRYRYYTMDTMRVQLKQPKAYLIEVMRKIGKRVDGGQANNYWGLNDTYQDALDRGFGQDVKAEEMAPVLKLEDGDEEDEDGDHTMGDGGVDDDDGSDDDVFEEA
ncbi:hypothetical protein FKW77_008401 [Venturia effusa]|uniref:Transcription initiation factor IIF subunit beta n=1 Tax=Venturia effusa TaxID=50376 RepID=A0A517LBF0_9PEZI|nr:hypothetical protein FKW77_008401 [Venturia effusa]